MPEDGENCRFDALSEADRECFRLPETKLCNDVVKAFTECGRFLSGASGIIPLTWQEVDSYIRLNNSSLSAWAISQIIAMSRAYCSSYYQSRDKNMPAPFGVFSDKYNELKRKENDRALRIRRESMRK